MTESKKVILKFQMFYIEDALLEEAIAHLPLEIRSVFNEYAWRKMGFVCDDGSSFLIFKIGLNDRKIVITIPGTKEPLKVFKGYLKKNLMTPHLIDNQMSVEV